MKRIIVRSSLLVIARNSAFNSTASRRTLFTTIKSASFLNGRNKLSNSHAVRIPSWFIGTCPSTKEWHGSHFLRDRSVEDKESWLLDFISRDPNGVDCEAFLIVLRALAKSTKPDAAVRAERWLIKLEKLSEQNSACFPITECYQRVIEAWAANPHEDPNIVVARAERWLDRISLTKDASGEATTGARFPNTACFNAFLDACSKGRSLKNSGKRDIVRSHAMKAQDVLSEMVQDRIQNGSNSKIKPNQESFNFVIRAWTRCRRSGDVAERTLEALRAMEDYHAIDSTVHPNSKSYAMLMDSIAVKIRLKVRSCQNRLGVGNGGTDPNENGLNDIKLLEETVQFMKDSARSKDDWSAAPKTVNYNIIISAWANAAPLHDMAPKKAERLLQTMASENRNSTSKVDASPDAISYMLVMRAWANSKKGIRGKRVSFWLSELWAAYGIQKRPDLLPSTTVYNVAIRTWADLGQPHRAEALLLDLRKIAESSNEGSLRPNSESYSLLVRAWLSLAEQGNKEALERAVYWLQVLVDGEQKDIGLSSSVDLFSGILAAARNCAAHSPDVLDIALETFDHLKKSHHPLDPLHYSRLMQVALLALSKPENIKTRESFVAQLVSDCQEDGLVSSALIRAFANGPTFQDRWAEGQSEKERLATKYFAAWPLPAHWCRNVRQTGMFPRKSDLQSLRESGSGRF